MAAYLDDRKRVNVWIVVMTIPAIALLGARLLSTMAVDSTSVLVDVQNALDTVSSAALISPLFALLQLSMIVRGTAGASWQNILCVVLTIAAAVMVWMPQMG